MSLQRFITLHAEEINDYIYSHSQHYRIDNYERRLWVLNDKALYRWAQREGVKI